MLVLNDDIGRVCKAKEALDAYRTFNVKAQKLHKEGKIKQAREMSWKVGMFIELAIALRFNMKNENGWSWTQGAGDWDFISNTQRADVKGCRSSEYNGNIFIERDTNGYRAGWAKNNTKDRETTEMDLLLYVDSNTDLCYCIKTYGLLNYLTDNVRSVNGGNGNAAKGWVVSLTQLKEDGFLVAEYQL